MEEGLSVHILELPGPCPLLVAVILPLPHIYGVFTQYSSSNSGI